jgi:ABC-2 type transport system permease protein
MTMLLRLLADRRRGFCWWAVGAIGGIAATVGLWPSVRDNPDFERVVEDLPETVRAMIGTQADIALTSAPGYLQARLFATLLPVLLLVYAISLGAGAIGTTEEDGTLQLVVTAPVTRRRLALERLAGSTLLLLGLAAVSVTAIVALAAPTGLLDEVSAGQIMVATGAVLAHALFHGSIAFAVGATTGRRSPAVAAAAGIAVAGYVINAVAASAHAVEPARAFSPWWWLLDRNLLVQPATLSAVVLPLVLAVTVGSVGVAIFRRRDLKLP